MFQKNRSRRLRSQLVLAFLLSSLGIGIALGLPAILLINRQASSQTQLFLDQATSTTRVFLASEQSDLQNLALLISQRPTLTRLLAEQDLVALESYLDTLRDSVDLDLILVCAEGKEVKGIGENISMSELCAATTASGYAILSSNDDLYLHTAVDLESSEQPAYKVVAGKRMSRVLTKLQKETGLVYFLVLQDQVIRSSDASINTTPAQAAQLQEQSNQPTNLSLERKALSLNDHQYVSTVLPMEKR